MPDDHTHFKVLFYYGPPPHFKVQFDHGPPASKQEQEELLLAVERMIEKATEQMIANSLANHGIPFFALGPRPPSTLDLAGLAFDRSLASLSCYHGLGPFRFFPGLSGPRGRK